MTHIHFKFCIRKFLLEIKRVLLKLSFLCISTIFFHSSKPSSNANGIQSCYMKTKSVFAKLSIRERSMVFVLSVVEIEKVRKVCQASN